jgi:hypothetical protein
MCAVAGRLIGLAKGEGTNPVSVRERVTMGVLFATNMITTQYTLLYLSYPVQVIGRNVRFLCVVLIGAFFSRVQHKHAHLRLGKHKLLMAAVITGGVLLFNFAKVGLDLGREARTGPTGTTPSWPGWGTCC